MVKKLVVRKVPNTKHYKKSLNEVTDLIQKQTLKVLQTLTPHEEKVLRLRFGIEGEDKHTLGEIGEEISRSRERVRQIEVKALKKLRDPTRSKRLKSFIDW